MKRANGQPMREPPDIPEGHLRACLREQYDLSPVTFEFLPLGLDSRAGVYRVVCERGAPLLLKVKSGPHYAPSCLVPRYLRDQGIPEVVAPLPTTRDALWTQILAGDRADWVVTVYPFVEGYTGWKPALTEAQWEAVGTAVKQIHRVMPPPDGFESLRKETFDASAYGSWVRAFDEEHMRATGGGFAEQALRAVWVEHRPALYKVLTVLEGLADVLRGQSGPQVICHADLHPGNIIRDHASRVFVIDWDDVMLAPKERDFIFIREAPENGPTGTDVGMPPFFRGYGPVEIDWVALTYYRCERVVQDVIEYAREIFFRDDLGDATKADSVRYFGLTFAPGGNADAVWAAATHLPADLRFRDDAVS